MSGFFSLHRLNPPPGIYVQNAIQELAKKSATARVGLGSESALQLYAYLYDTDWVSIASDRLRSYYNAEEIAELVLAQVWAAALSCFFSPSLLPQDPRHIATLLNDSEFGGEEAFKNALASAFTALDALTLHLPGRVHRMFRHPGCYWPGMGARGAPPATDAMELDDATEPPRLTWAEGFSACPALAQPGAPL